MRRYGLYLIACITAFVFSEQVKAQGGAWADLKGSVTWAGDPKAQAKIEPKVDVEVCAMDKAPLEEDYIINPVNKGLKNVFVWLRPVGAAKGAAFPPVLIHPALLKPANPNVEIDQPCCRFIPHVLAAREGQNMIIKNSAIIAHNAKWTSKANGDFNVLIPAKGQYKLEKPLAAEGSEIFLQCSIHSWMKAHVRVFDHPYFAITDSDGKWEIKDAPVGKFSIFVHHPATGWLDGANGRNGQVINIPAGGANLPPFAMK